MPPPKAWLMLPHTIGLIVMWRPHYQVPSMYMCEYQCSVVAMQRRSSSWVSLPQWGQVIPNWRVDYVGLASRGYLLCRDTSCPSYHSSYS
ncbi:hypothetical protein PR003_g13975 [Phytophthora rubi]|uniref:Secreted protein n=1 Tax=Phytophthora rubi TaxID=129364 RepID=A0A6A3JQM8_9STRA|nr:hypothetical protein PR001_g20049 [Phytophthora rubi]KAE9015089.1 hypothetical protein PR002_g14029 [Phytophthora rubi]KAE9333528.1 hypothetical protein PR003_g13975 [Phytophthora rubi]